MFASIVHDNHRSEAGFSIEARHPTSSAGTFVQTRMVFTPFNRHASRAFQGFLMLHNSNVWFFGTDRRRRINPMFCPFFVRLQNRPL
jgi:hypothetical protein